MINYNLLFIAAPARILRRPAVSRESKQSKGAWARAGDRPYQGELKALLREASAARFLHFTQNRPPIKAITTDDTSLQHQSGTSALRSLWCWWALANLARFGRVCV